ncbi:MAG: type II toxin-antitoxin system VapC family toxin, partial [Thiohalorhabdaceae bacterium]
RQGDDKGLARYDEFFSDPALIKISLAERVLERASQLRADHGLKTPDAIQAALALGEGVQFVTGDQDFWSLGEVKVHRIRI